jgi:putative chitinase
MLLTERLLKQLAPNANEIYKQSILTTQEDVYSKYDINTRLRQNHFLAQILHESSGLTIFQENLNYSAKRLMQVWPRRFPTLSIAQQYEHNPKALANKTYGGRLGNINDGDGWLYRGRGMKQLTGRYNYTKLSKEIDVDFVSNPDLVCSKEYAFIVAGWFWDAANCNQYADKNSINGVTKAINGGLIGINERIEWKKKVDRILST